jgi:hypothetical protein
VNLIAPGFVDTPLSAAILAGELDARREQLTPPGSLMTNPAVTGATYDIDGGQQLVG